MLNTPCDQCTAQIRTSPHGWARPFPVCISLPGHFGGSCGNCKWQDHASRCSIRDAADAPSGRPNDGNDDDDDDDIEFLGSRPVLAAGGSADNAIILA